MLQNWRVGGFYLFAIFCPLRVGLVGFSVVWIFVWCGFFVFCFRFSLETGLFCQADLVVTMPLLSPLRCWDYGQVHHIQLQSFSAAQHDAQKVLDSWSITDFGFFYSGRSTYIRFLDLSPVKTTAFS